MQYQLSLFFKSPYKVAGKPLIHDLFEQHTILRNWVDKVSPKLKA